jgi:hypothetical protein
VTATELGDVTIAQSEPVGGALPRLRGPDLDALVRILAALKAVDVPAIDRWLTAST